MIYMPILKEVIIKFCSRKLYLTSIQCQGTYLVERKKEEKKREREKETERQEEEEKTVASSSSQVREANSPCQFIT